MMWYDFISTNLVAVSVLLLVLLIFLRSASRPANLPPGPRPWPVLGNLLSVRGDMLQTLQNLRTRYGDVYLLYLGSVPTVFVYGQTSIKEVLTTRGDEFADRPKTFVTEEIAKDKGLIGASGQLWKEQRRFTLHTLRNFGFGKSTLEGKVIEEIEVLIQCLRDKRGSTFPVGKLLHTSVSNVICSIVFGNRFQHDDPTFVDYMRRLDENFEASAFAGPMNSLPWLKYLPGDFFKVHKSLRNLAHVERYINGQIENHKETFTPGDPRDFIDAYLEEMDRCKTDPSSTFEDEQLLKVIGDLFVAGSETTATTLQWALVYLINNPDVQARVRDEIHSVIGRDRFPTMNDRKRMPYMEATLMEIQRCGDIAPLGVPHAASQDTTLEGHTILKGTTVITVLSSLHNDPVVWKKPEVFDPSRFLDSGGNVTKSDNLMPFSAGKRVCPGETLARMELFLFLTAMLQRFVFKPPEGVTSLSEERIVGITQRPKSLNLRAIAE